MFESVSDVAVRCTPTQAFDHVARGFFEHHGVWDPSVTSMEKISSGPVGLDTRGLEGRRFGPWHMVSEFRVTAFEPDRRFGFATTGGPMVEELDVTIEGRPDGSWLRIHLRLTPSSLGLRILEPLIRPSLSGNVRANTERMRTALNAEGDDRVGSRIDGRAALK